MGNGTINATRVARCTCATNLATYVVTMASSVSRRSASKSKAAKTPRRVLSLKEKYDVIETSKKKNFEVAARDLAAKFGCGRTQINSIPKRVSNMSSTCV